MKALVLTEYKKLAYTDFPDPEPAADELLIGVRACGICGSDIHGWDGSTGRRLPPLIMGHEASGVVLDAGPAVTGFAKGDRVTFDSMLWCGECVFCRKGRMNLCENRKVLGVSPGEYKKHGAFAEYVTVPARVAVKLPEEVSFEHAAMVEPVSVAVHGVSLVPVTLGDTAVVVGSGMIGLLVIQVLRLAGCGRVIAVDLEDRKLEVAKRVGADAGLNPSKVDVAAEVKALTGGLGADITVDAVGATAPVKTAIAAVRKGGSVCLIGNLAPNVELPLQSVVTREVTLYGSCASSGEYPACLDLLARKAIQVDPILSATAPLSEGHAWFERLYGHDSGLMKVLLKP